MIKSYIGEIHLSYDELIIIVDLVSRISVLASGSYTLRDLFGKYEHDTFVNMKLGGMAKKMDESTELLFKELNKFIEDKKKELLQ